MKIYCIYSIEDYASINKPLPAFSSISFGISYIASVLKKAGHSVRLFVCTPNKKSLKHIIDEILKEKPTLLCLTAVTSQYSLMSNVALKAKEVHPDITIIIGGHHVTLNPESSIQEPYFNAICIGEGEQAIINYAQQIEKGIQPHDIKNLWIRNKKTGEIEKNPQAEFLQDLDSLPFIDQSLWEEWIVDKNRMHSIIVGRGCPNRCTYCSNHVLCKSGTGKYVRFRSTENIIEELKQLNAEFPDVTTVHLEAETLSVNLDYTSKLLVALKDFNTKSKHPLLFGTNLSMRNVLIDNKEFVELFKNANFAYINIGLESGSERIRNDILRRPKYSNDEIMKFCSLIKSFGIHINMFVLIGVPGETLTDYQETIKCVQLCAPEHVFQSIFYPYPGTDLYNTAKEQGLIKETILKQEMERKKAIINLPGFSKKQIQREYILFASRAYKGRKPFLIIVVHIIQAYISVHPLLNRIYRYTVRHPFLRLLQSKISSFSK